MVGTNLLYTLHWYSCTHGQSFRNLGNKAIAGGIALFVTEFGATFSDGGPAPNHDYVCEGEANLWFAWMLQNNISGVSWKLDQCADASCILGFECLAQWTLASQHTQRRHERGALPRYAACLGNRNPGRARTVRGELDEAVAVLPFY